jgi:hypothetical protein
MGGRVDIPLSTGGTRLAVCFDLAIAIVEGKWLWFEWALGN